MDLINHFKKSLEIDLTEQIDAPGVFEKVADLLAKKHDISQDGKNSIRDAFLERESTGTTAFGFGIALPHVFCTAIESVTIVVCNVSEGIDMGAFDGVPTKNLICIVASESTRETYLALLQQVAKVTRDTRWRKFIQQSGSAAGVIDILVEAAGG